DGRGERVAAEGRAVLTRTDDAQHIAVADDGGNRKDAATERLAEQIEVGNDPLTVAREGLPDPAEACLDLIRDEQYAPLIADLADPLQVALGRDDDPALALDRFDEHRGGVIGDCSGDGIRVSVRNRIESG